MLLCWSGFCSSLQHRFYGESKPHNLAKTLGYLNSQQALADYAILIRSLKQNLSSEASPVVVFGGSYGGSKLTKFQSIVHFLLLQIGSYQTLVCCSLFPETVLAAWFRLKYPHITIGALASSAPILQFDKIVPSSSFYDVVSQDFKVCIFLYKMYIQ